MLSYRKLKPDEIERPLFQDFERRQIVTKCWRKEAGNWMIKDAPFIDDWSRQEYEELVRCLKHTAASGGLVCGAFSNGSLKGFVSVEGTPIGSTGQYLDLSSLHVSQDMRRHGIGRELFLRAKLFAKEKQAKKLYISAHSAVETQAFYRSMGCSDAIEYQREHVEKEPFDRQLECSL